MTRWARPGSSYRKKANEASSWAELNSKAIIKSQSKPEQGMACKRKKRNNHTQVKKRREVKNIDFENNDGSKVFKDAETVDSSKPSDPTYTVSYPFTWLNEKKFKNRRNYLISRMKGLKLLAKLEMRRKSRLRERRRNKKLIQLKEVKNGDLSAIPKRSVPKKDDKLIFNVSINKDRDHSQNANHLDRTPKKVQHSKRNLPKFNESKPVVEKLEVALEKNMTDQEEEKQSTKNTSLEDKSLVESLEEYDDGRNQRQRGDYRGGRDSKRETRRLQRVEDRQKGKVCFKCREPGHMLANCPMMAKEGQGTGICLKCGSTEHHVYKCRRKVTGDKEYPFAKCFICQEMGHLAKSCPDNPRGLYPYGGCCKECGSVEHKWWMCPSLKNVKGTPAPYVSTIKNSVQSADAVLEEPQEKPVHKKSGKSKIITF